MKKSYIFSVTQDDSGTLKFKGKCNGFSAWEVLGFVTHKCIDLSKQISCLQDGGAVGMERIIVTQKSK